jgi:SAM-dependent methyltransferase
LSNSSHIIPLPRNVPVFIGRQEFVVDYAAGKRVLHLGCVDEGLTEKKHQQGLLLHERLQRNTRELWGVDVDAEGLRWLQEYGYTHLYQADIEDLSSVPELKGQSFDLILLTEVMEHLDNPGRFLQEVRFLFGPDTELLITVPNATSLANLMMNWQSKELVHPDHNYWFSLHTISALLGKFNYRVTFTAVYSQHDFRRSISRHLFQRLSGRRSGEPANPAFQNEAHTNSGEAGVNKRGMPDVAGWLKVVRTTLVYRRFLSRNPFFADGLILIAKPDFSREI